MDRKKVAALALCCTVCGGVLAGGGSYLFLRGQNRESVQEAPVSTVMEGVREKSVIDVTYIDTGNEMTPAEVYAAQVIQAVHCLTCMEKWSVLPMQNIPVQEQKRLLTT